MGSFPPSGTAVLETDTYCSLRGVVPKRASSEGEE